jgi:hypothetical protein
MTDVGKLLRESDPGITEPGLSAADAQRMRRVILAEASRPAPAWWPTPIAVAATIVLTLAAGAFIGQRLPREIATPARAGPAGDVQPQMEPAARQLQFATPGGTRIIWVLNPDFDL